MARSPAALVSLFVLVAGLATGTDARADELRDAVDRIRQETGGYILSAQTVRTHGGKVHRVKVLTREGRVEVRQIAGAVGGDPIGFTRDVRRVEDDVRAEPRWTEGRWQDERPPRNEDARWRARHRGEPEGPTRSGEHRATLGPDDAYRGPRAREPYGREAPAFDRRGPGSPGRDDFPAEPPD
jgi:hypothetical protein